jgi:kynurenine formamidase
MDAITFSRLSDADIIQLGQPMTNGAPHALHPPFEYELLAGHGDPSPVPGQDPRITGAHDSIRTGLHTGTHIDALSHVAFEGRLSDGTPVGGDAAAGIRMRSGESMRPIVAPGVLLDFPSYLGVSVLAPEYVISADELLGCAEHMGVAITPGSVVLLRTGRDALWDTPARFGRAPFPGPDLGAAQLLAERGIVATGSDTIPYEQAPSDDPMTVHAELLARGGIYIMECLNLIELARRRAARFLFVALPLRIPTATASPINPVALLLR